MGHKKRIAAPRSKQSPASPPSADSAGKVEAGTNAAKSNGLIESDGSSYSAIKQECERALTALRRGSHTKALRLMKDSCASHENSPHSALIYRVQGTVCVKVAAIIDDPTAKQRHMRNAIDSARRAVELSPNSIEFAHFYANLLYEAANEAKEYEEVVAECERALAIENPVDPAKESLQEENQQKIMSADARIGHVQGELRNLIQKSNFASISSWMKNLGADDKFRLIPIRRPAEDPIESKLVQARRPNETRKATKTPEERRKEIEVRVAAARLLQQQSESVGPQNSSNGDKGLDSSLGGGHKSTSERRKHGKKNEPSSDRKEWARSYWNSLTNETKKAWLSFRVSEVKAHYAFSKDGGLAVEVFSEAVEHAAANNTWKYWICCKCNMKFPDSESHLEHVVHEHIGNVLPSVQSFLPQNVGNEWSEMISSCSWKPLDVSAALQMIADQQKCQDGEDFSSGKISECDDRFRDACESSPEKDDSGHCTGACNGAESNGYERSVSTDSCGHNENQALIAYCPIDTWPMSDDPERAKLLERIHSLFDVLIRHKCLSDGHLGKVLQFTIDELQGLTDGSKLLNCGVNQTPICICFLGADQLRKIIKFLQEITGSSGLGKYPEKPSRHLENGNAKNQTVEINEKILLNEDGSCILLDEGFLPTECESNGYHDSTTHDAAGPNPAKLGSDVDYLFSWIYSGPSCTELLASWMHKREEIANQCLENYQLLEKESTNLQKMCERKSELIGYEEALQVLEELCIEEGKRRENGDELAQRSHEAFLKKRREEIKADENESSFNINKIEREVIKNVLKDAETLNVNQFGYDDAYGGVASPLRDLEAAEDEDWRTKDYVQQVDTCIEVSFQKQKEESYMEMCKLDTRIMRSVTMLHQLELKFEAGSALDYQWVLVPLMKLYMRMRLETLAERYALEKSDAAREAFLAELALDSNKGLKGGNNNLKHGQEKTKDKKKQRKTKEMKAGGTGERHTIYHETDELDSGPVSCDGEHPDSAIISSVGVDELKEQEEELRMRVEFEAQERQLEETLEYQRQIENEAKQRQLAEQHKKLAQTYVVKAAEGLPDVSVEPNTGNQHRLPQLKPSMELLQKDDQPNCSDGSSENAGFTSLLPNGSSTNFDSRKTRTDHAENRREAEDDVIPSDRRMGRKARRQKNSAQLSKSASPSGKEDAEGPSQEQIHRADGDHKATMLRQLHVEEQNEVRFQADLKKAVRQSLDAYQAHKKLPPPSAIMPEQTSSVNSSNIAFKPAETSAETNIGSDVGTGLQNEIGEYNCFLNVIIQSLWHIRRFRNEFLKSSGLDHIHVGDPCVVCALHEVFTALCAASVDPRREAVAPTSLRIALSNLYPHSNFFQEGQMNDASEVLAVIFDCLHKSFTQSANDKELVENNSIGSWDCKDCKACPVHSLFGMDIFERMNCDGCGLESRHLKYTSFFHNINANALRTMKAGSTQSSFDELLNLVERNHQLACDPEAGGCGKLNHICHFLSAPPHVFTAVLGWQKTRESANDITATLAALNAEINMSILYRGLDQKQVHNVVSVVCYYGQHYHCFAYSHDRERWIMYDDKTVKEIGSWADVLSICERGRLQPQVLFFEAVKQTEG